jgi:hypothetical protein
VIGRETTARSWLHSDAVQTVLARTVADPRGTLTAIGVDSNPAMLAPAVTAMALAEVMTAELEHRAEAEVDARYVTALRWERAIGHGEGLRDAASYLTGRARRAEQSGNAGLATYLDRAADTLSAKAVEAEAGAA